MRRVTAGAALTDCFVFKNKWTALSRVALGARFVQIEKEHPAPFDLLRKIRFASLECHSPVRVMAIDAANLAFQDGVAMR
jgi:hypothetical protein